MHLFEFYLQYLRENNTLPQTQVVNHQCWLSTQEFQKAVSTLRSFIFLNLHQRPAELCRIRCNYVYRRCCRSKDANLSSLEGKTKPELQKLTDWAVNNKLSLNFKKNSVFCFPIEPLVALKKNASRSKLLASCLN